MSQENSHNREDIQEEVSAMIRNANHTADIRGTRRALNDIPEACTPGGPAMAYVDQAKTLMPTDGTPLLQENLERAITLLDTANSIETSQEILALRDRAHHQLKKIKGEAGTTTNPYSE